MSIRGLHWFVSSLTFTENLCSEIAKETSYNAELELVDLDNFASVVALAKRLHGQPIDILVANAAVARTEYIATKDGWEQMYVPLLNHMQID